MDIAIPMYDRFTALDAVGPYEVLSRLPDAQVTWLAHEPGLVRTDNHMLAIEATAAFEDLPSPDIILVPGGTGTRDLLEDERLLSWLRGAHATSTWTTSVCTGSLLLAGAGILNGLSATTHWLAMDKLRELGAQPSRSRVVEDGRVITSAGVSSGIDMALRLTKLLYGPELAQSLQLAIEYDPEPPFDAGSPDKAPDAIVDAVRTVMTGRGDIPT